MKQETEMKKYMVPLLFAVSAVVRFVMANYYPKTINCYPDELLYLSGGASLWNQHKMLVFQVPSTFGRIGYCLAISPAFAFADLRVRGMLIAAINAVLVSLGIFPVYGIAKRILKEKKYILLSLALYMISPTLTYSMTYMSENLYLPVALLLLYVLLRYLEAQDKKAKVVSGMLFLLLTGIAYYIKSVALAFLVAFVLLCLTELFFSGEKKKRVAAGVIFVAGILAAVVVLMTGWIAWDASMLTEKGLYIAFGFVFYILITIMAVCVIPILLPGIAYRSMGEKEKKFYLFLLYLILTTALVVAAMIYTTEDYPSLTPRAHVRYVEFVFVPFVILVFHLLECKVQEVSRRRIQVVFGIWAVIHLVVFRGFSGQTVDQTMLFYWQLIAKGGKEFTTTSVVALGNIIILVALGVTLLFDKHREWFRKILVIGLIVMSLGNSALSVFVQYKTHTHMEGETAEAEQLRAFVRDHGDDTFWVLEPEGFDELIDTYLVDCTNVRVGTKPVLSQKEEEFTLPESVEYVLMYDPKYALHEKATPAQAYPTLGYTLYQLENEKNAAEITVGDRD